MTTGLSGYEAPRDPDSLLLGSPGTILTQRAPYLGLATLSGNPENGKTGVPWGPPRVWVIYTGFVTLEAWH